VRLATTNALAIGAGHLFVVLLRGGFPVSVLNPMKLVPEVCAIFCATANAVEVLVAVTDRGGGSSASATAHPRLEQTRMSQRAAVCFARSATSSNRLMPPWSGDLWDHFSADAGPRALESGCCAKNTGDLRR
jgi:hypothetical protein